ncbi:MAG: UDP-glucose 4-epimerase GalE [Pseudomonadota bacterium]|nr:UDP-glucose 4-epimerase GalE [Pseudomonadota bacterium]
MNFLIVGGAGYIGSHMVKLLVRRGHDVTTYDNLSSGHRNAVVGGRFVFGDLADRETLSTLLREGRFDGAMHFASYIQVSESTIDPAKYYRNNFVNTLNLLDAMVDAGVRRLIFSSTAAVFGEPQYVPIDEAHVKAPINPYGRTKWAVEQALHDYGVAYGLNSVCLRYFNAAGADPEGELGERHDPETHLIPLTLRAARGGKALKVFGRDYDTPDGTCVRDYVHVWDLCEAHLLAFERLDAQSSSLAYNLGNGEGYSVQAIIDAAARVTNLSVPVEEAPRRPGDPARLVADSRRARAELNWRPRYADLDTIVRHAWQWDLNNAVASNTSE